MRKASRNCLLFTVALVATGVLLLISFHNARKEADELIAGIPERWERLEWRLQVLRSITGNDRLAAWEFSYEPESYFVNAPLALQVTLGGEVVASNPRDKLSKLRALQKSRAVEATQ